MTYKGVSGVRYENDLQINFSFGGIRLKLRKMFN